MSRKWSCEVLPGLPVYGPLADPFSATGQGKHREGLVIRFNAETGENWVGNFQRGITGVDRTFDHSNGNAVIVVAGGQGYTVDPESRQCLGCFGGTIESMFFVPELGSIIFGNGLWFESIGANGLLWRSRRVSWDGMRDLAIADQTLTGRACNLSGHWIQFAVDLKTGTSSGGSYSGPSPF